MSAKAGVIATAVTIHVPRIAIEELAPPFQKDIIEGSKAMGRHLRALKPDAIVIVTAHWVSTFNWYTTSHAVHEGVCVADEAPDLVPGLPYRHAGDPALADAIVAQVKATSIPIMATDCPDLSWDYATYVPLKYIDPDAEVPVIRMPSVICCNLDEAMKVGAAVHAAARAADKRVVLIASSALSHAVARGPEGWPTPERIDMDKHFIAETLAGNHRAVIADFPRFAKEAAGEMGGKPIATMFGAVQALLDEGTTLSTRQFGPYTQSSGSGNANMVWETS